MLLLRLGFFKGLVSYLFLSIQVFFSKFSVYLLWSVTKTATDIKPGNVGSNNIENRKKSNHKEK